MEEVTNLKSLELKEFLKNENNKNANENDTEYYLRSSIAQKNEEIKSLNQENKTLRQKLNDRPMPSELSENLRKIEELEKIIEMLKYELETLKMEGSPVIKDQKRDKSAEHTHTHRKDKNFLVKSHITRENMRRDRVLNNLKGITQPDFPNYEAMKRLFRTLTEIFKTSHLIDIIDKAEFAQKAIDNGDDFVKFFYKTKELLISCIPDDINLNIELNFRHVFKVIVKVVER